MSAPLLAARDLHTFYGESHVLHGVQLAVAPGETVTLMETTALKVAAGLLRPTQGDVLIAGRRVNGVRPEALARRGLCLVPEGRGIFPALTVREHLVMAARPGRWTEERALDLFPQLRNRLHSLGSQLSGGEQQMVAIARALLTNPELIILDGATEGLAPVVRREIWLALRRLRSEGTAVLIVDKEVRRLLEIGDRHLILVKGRVAFSGTTAEFLASAEQNLSLLRA